MAGRGRRWWHPCALLLRDFFELLLGCFPLMCELLACLMSSWWTSRHLLGMIMDSSGALSRRHRLALCTHLLMVLLLSHTSSPRLNHSLFRQFCYVAILILRTLLLLVVVVLLSLRMLLRIVELDQVGVWWLVVKIFGSKRFDRLIELIHALQGARWDADGLR